MAKSIKVLVLCHGNINRSPACEAVLRTQGVKAISAGFREANVGRPAARKMRELLASIDPRYDLSTHRSQLICHGLVSWADTILYMDGGNRRRLMAAYPDAMTKAFPLGRWLTPPKDRIADPAYFRKGSPQFETVVRELIDASLAFSRNH